MEWAISYTTRDLGSPIHATLAHSHRTVTHPDPTALTSGALGSPMSATAIAASDPSAPSLSPSPPTRPDESLVSVRAGGARGGDARDTPFCRGQRRVL